MTWSPYIISWLPAALTDLLVLNAADEQLADSALAALDDIAHHRQRGKVLGKRNVSGDLTGMYRLRFDVAGEQPQRYRIVYRLTPAERPIIAEVVALGPRADHAIYRQTAARALPSPSPPSED